MAKLSSRARKGRCDRSRSPKLSLHCDAVGDGWASRVAVGSALCSSATSDVEAGFCAEVRRRSAVPVETRSRVASVVRGKLREGEQTWRARATTRARD